MMDILLVDGYNMIGAWPELQKMKEHDLEGARDLLVNKLAEYQAYTGDKVIIIFDAHLVPGLEQAYHHYNVKVIYTNENETADEKIEQLAGQIGSLLSKVYVATSDYAEQKTIFGQGALRKSARELLNEIEKIESEIALNIRESSKQRRLAKIPLSPETEKIFEKWRRGIK